MAPGNFLVFGGNGFAGAPFVKRLLTMKETVTIVSRGNWYWDTKDTIKPYVQHVKFDRLNPSPDDITGLQKVLDENDFDAVIDFSAVRGLAIENTLKVLKNKVKVYIHISSDSVYEVSSMKTHDGFSRETDSGRPDDPVLREQYAKADDYADEKMKGEEVLMSHSEFPHVFLRLPDIMGAEDTTRRWWVYQMWIKLSATMGIPVSLPPKAADVPLSFVYNKDVTDAIVNILASGQKYHNEAFNLAFSQPVSLRKLLAEMQNNLHAPGLEYDTTSDLSFFPSVLRGPIDITKATKEIGWSPALFEDVAREAVQFFEGAITTYPHQRDDIAVCLAKMLKIDPQRVFDAIKKVYGIADVPTGSQHEGRVNPEWFAHYFDF